MKSVVYQTRTALSCDCNGCEGIICLSTDLVPLGFIPVTISKPVKDCSDFFTYVITYDENLLIYDPTYTLIPTDVLGAFCKDCVANWLESIATQELTLGISDTPSIELFLASDILSASSKISADADNSISIHADGLYVPAADSFTVSDTSSVDMSMGLGIIASDVKISADADNSISIHADGLYVPEEVGISVTDSNSVNLTLAADNLIAEVKVSLDADNAISVHADGIYAPADVLLSVDDTESVDLTLAADIITADVKISADVDNGLSIHADGLYVVAGAGTTITVDDTDSIDLTLALGVVTADSKISADADNAISIHADGLYVPEAPDGVPVGAVIQMFSVTAPSGYLRLAGQTIGNAASGATLRANADTLSLFTHFWDNLANAQAAVSGGRGASAAADFAANKTLTVPNMMQKFPIGTAASGTGSTLGGTGGVIDHTHVIGAHYHGMAAGADFNITSSGATTSGNENVGHTHFTASGTGHFLYINGGGSDGSFSGVGAGAGMSYDNTTGLASNTHTHSVPAHTHSSANFAGRIGLVTGGVSGDAAMTSGGSNPPFIAINFFVRY